MSKPIRTLTPQEMERLPHCRWSWDTHAKCKEERTTTKDCVKCAMEALLIENCHTEGESGAVHILDGLAAMLKELKVLE